MTQLTTQQKLEYSLHALCLLPLVVVFAIALLTIAGFSTTLGFVSATTFLTDGAMFAFAAMLVMTPITILTGWRWPQTLKRPLGLYAFAYSAIHFLIFSGGFGFAPVAIASGAFATAMLAAGSIALIGFIPLALTSNRWSMRMLGRNWKRLHMLTYAIALFIIVHLFFLGQALPWAIVFTLLLAIRIPPIRKTIIRWRTGRSKATQPAAV